MTKKASIVLQWVWLEADRPTLGVAFDPLTRQPSLKVFCRLAGLAWVKQLIQVIHKTVSLGAQSKVKELVTNVCAQLNTYQ